jgi:hypothetical protein
MDKKQVVEIIKTIATLYGNKFKFDDPAAIVETWLKILKDYDFDIVMANLEDYVKSNHYPPSVADLVKTSAPKDRAIPTRDETLAMFEKWDQAKQEASNEKVANDHLAKMRKILGIKRG